MKFSFEGVTFLKAISKPYNFQGNVGTSNKANVLVEGTLYSCKVEPETLAKYKDLVEVKGIADFELTSNKENSTLWLRSFKAE